MADKIISSIQSTFIEGMFMLDSVTILHEPVTSYAHEKGIWCFFKVDFEKAYDKINWNFTFSVLDMKYFWNSLLTRPKL
jgi:hypothetical protein